MSLWYLWCLYSNLNATNVSRKKFSNNLVPVLQCPFFWNSSSKGSNKLYSKLWTIAHSRQKSLVMYIESSFVIKIPLKKFKRESVIARFIQESDNGNEATMHCTDWEVIYTFISFSCFPLFRSVFCVAYQIKLALFFHFTN